MYSGDGASPGVVLVVDDDLSIRVVVARRFTSLGYEVVEASNGAEGVEVVGSRRVALVVSDWNMPSMDGVEMARALAGGTRGAGPPVLLLTARDFDATDEVLAGTNVVGVLRKPFSARKLVERALSVLGGVGSVGSGSAGDSG